MYHRFLFLFIFSSVCWSQSHINRIGNTADTVTVIGPRNIPLYEGAQALLSGDHKEGIRLTHLGLKEALGNREESAALSNLCAGYIRIGKYSEAIKYCNQLLKKYENNWRGLNSRAVAYIMTNQLDLAEIDLFEAEKLNPNATTLKVAREIFTDIVNSDLLGQDNKQLE